MIYQSFVFLPRVSHNTERKIWSQGIHDWDDFLAKSSVFGFSGLRKKFLDSHIIRARNALRNDDLDFFHENLPKRDHFRLYNQLKDETVFLDIETSGYYGDLTVLGLYDGQDTKTFVRGINMDRKTVLKELSRYKAVVTFNGLSFDMPILQKYFGFKWDKPHIDLRFICSRLGYSGGLKNIEKIFNIRRPDGIDGMSGEDAVTLWRDWRKNHDREALDRIIAYNEEDIVNLKPLAEKTIPLLWKNLRKV
ncbi:exonuclease [Candidatus Woesearchaeota archaeon]|nr:MAG: exonuclease [Candidatus Woesearchaeota archaeon]